MTVMFIPHNEKRIFTFQISKFFVSFFVLLFIIILITSSYAVIRNTSIKREEQRLLMNYKDIRSHLLRFEKNTIIGQTGIHSILLNDGMGFRNQIG